MRYLIFGGECYYPNAGGYDLLSEASNMDAARSKADWFVGKWAVTDAPDDKSEIGGNSRVTTWADVAAIQNHRIEWAHVLDTDTLEVVYEAGAKPYSGDRHVIRVVDKDPE